MKKMYKKGKLKKTQYIIKCEKNILQIEINDIKLV